MIYPIPIDNDSVLPVCAVRYALGRQTYMPGMVVDEIKPMIPKLSDRNLLVIAKDLAEYLEHTKEHCWEQLYKAIENECDKRGMAGVK